jgi:hypothetical protein
LVFERCGHEHITCKFEKCTVRNFFRPGEAMNTAHTLFVCLERRYVEPTPIARDYAALSIGHCEYGVPCCCKKPRRIPTHITKPLHHHSTRCRRSYSFSHCVKCVEAAETCCCAAPFTPTLLEWLPRKSCASCVARYLLVLVYHPPHYLWVRIYIGRWHIDAWPNNWCHFLYPPA